MRFFVLCLVALSTLLSVAVVPRAKLNKYVDEVHKAWIDTYKKQNPRNPHRIKNELKNDKGQVKWVNPGDTVSGYRPTGKTIDLVQLYASLVHDRRLRKNPGLKRTKPQLFKDYEKLTEKQKIEVRKLVTAAVHRTLERQPEREVYSSLVHERWMKANPWAKDSQPELFVDYERLSELEKDKDRHFVDVAKVIFK